MAVHFHQYSNPSHTIYNGTCCNLLCLTECNTVLQFCFRIGGTSHDSLDCPAGLFVMGSIGGDNVTFTDSVGDWENPVVIAQNFLPPVCFSNTVVMMIHSSFGKVFHTRAYILHRMDTNYSFNLSSSLARQHRLNWLIAYS